MPFQHQEKSVWFLTNIPAGKLQVSVLFLNFYQLQKMMQKQENAFPTIDLEVGLSFVGKIHWTFVVFKLCPFYCVQMIATSDLNDQTEPKSMLRKGEVVISKNFAFSRRQEYLGCDSWKSGAIREMLEWLTPGKHCRVRASFREWNYSGTNCSGFLHQGLMAHKENNLLKCTEEMCLSICTGKDTSTDEDP